MQRGAVLEDLLRTLPPEVALQVEDISNKQATSPERPALRRSQTQHGLQDGAHAAPMALGGASDIALQRRCAALEAQLDKWVTIAQMLASELAYREKRLWDWQMDNTNTKAILQKFKDKIKKGGDSGGGRGGGGGGGARDDANDGTAASAILYSSDAWRGRRSNRGQSWTATPSPARHNVPAATHARRGHAVGVTSLRRAKPSATRFAHQTKPAPAVTMESGGNLLDASS